MAEKTLKTRIKLRYDEYANWVSADPILEAGEVAVTAVPTGTGVEQTTPPAILFKVGNGGGENSRWSRLPWASGLAADVYAWAKKAAPDVDDFGNIIAAAKDGLMPLKDVVEKLNGLTGELTLNNTDGKISITANGSTINLDLDLSTDEKAALSSGITLAKVSTYDGYATEISAAKTAAETAQSTASSKYAKPTNGIPKTDLASDVQTSLDKADSALQSHQTVTLASGTKDGTLKLTVNDTTTDNIKVTGLQDLAYKSSLSKDDIGLSSVENKTLDTTVTAGSGNYITSGAVKTAIDSAISGVTQFDVVKYERFDELPATGKKGVIYIIAHAHSDGNDSYDEYIWNTALQTPAYEKIGNTDVNLDDYVKTLSGTANSGVVTNISKSGNTISVTSTSLATSSPAASGDTTTFIDRITQEANGKINATKKSVSTMTGATESAPGSKGLVPAPAAGDQAKFLRGDGTWVVPTNTDTQVNVTRNENTKAYLLATTADPTGIAKSTTGVADTGVYLGTDAGQLVAAEFKGKLTGNADTATKLNLGVEIDGVEFDGSGSITHYGDCDTAAGTAEKTVICPWFKLVYGARIAVKFTKSNSASNPTLNVHGTGAKPIYYRGQPISASYLAADRTYEFIYNDNQYELVGDINTDTDTHYTARLYVGASNAAKSNAAATNGNVYLNLVENNTVRDYHNIKGTGATTVTSDASGVITIYSSDNDTKNTAGSSDTSSKIFLVGATSQGANPQTYSHDTAYVGTDGCLYSNSKKVATLGDNNSFTGLNTFKKTSTDGNTDYLIKLDNSSTTPNIVLGSAPVGTTAPAVYTKYGESAISKVSASGKLDFTFPSTSGTLALKSDISDTKNTAGSTDTQDKIYLIGAKSQNSDYQQTYSQDTAYVDTDGCLYSGGKKVLTSADLSNYVNTTDTQPIAGNKTFTGMTTFGNPITCQSGVVATNGTNTLDNASLSYNSITRYTNNTGYRLTIPLKNGTIATLEDLSTYVSTDDVLILDGGNAAG